MLPPLFISCFLLSVLLLSPASSQAPRPVGRGRQFLSPINPNSNEFRRRRKEKCRNEFRTIDGICTNNKEKLWASTSRPHYAYDLSRSSEIATGQDLPSARHISNILSKQTSEMKNRRGLTEFFTFFGQYLDHNIVATPGNRDKSMPIPIPEYDDQFGNFTNNELPFHRSEVGIAFEFYDPRQKKTVSVVRPINSLTSVIDQSAVYGSDKVRAKALRSFTDGKLKTSNGNYLPLNTAKIQNSPSLEDKYFLAGDHRANEHPMLTSLHTLFMREHNHICDELKYIYPYWDEELLYQVARKINGAALQKIVYEEFYPAITGEHLPSYRGHRRRVNPTVSDVFSTAAFRIGHTMVGNLINRRNATGNTMSPLTVDFMFFREFNIMNEGIELFIRGSVHNHAQEVDTRVVDALRNFLFSKVPQESGFDLIAMNLQRGRDHSLPSYNSIRRLFRLRKARRFSHITSSNALQNELLNAYGTVDMVEAWVGMMAEDHVPGASMGPTLLKIWRKEFRRLRDGDRFFYLARNLFSKQLWRDYPRLTKMYNEKSTMKSIILRNTDVKSKELPDNVFINPF